ncbi:predicted protein [Streptomyces viridochromogenes DSM 40736]|uniref:Predicted protein n=1 Tax=Streptomyces viridochromogenes (strain DSM 40736 / JCM 4977 / BCRC 1201 / Tue 494) TaxID=591159 RepID=D9X882_STRVT|nr:predicted protein [Streptomyces viridochromogenes DSM 40736]
MAELVGAFRAGDLLQVNAWATPAALLVDDIQDGMTTLAKLTKQLDEEWEAEAKLIGEISDAFDLVDILLAAQARAKKG